MGRNHAIPQVAGLGFRVVDLIGYGEGGSTISEETCRRLVFLLEIPVIVVLDSIRIVVKSRLQ